jgi:hypothetical protein
MIEETDNFPLKLLSNSTWLLDERKEGPTKTSSSWNELGEHRGFVTKEQ